MTEHPNLAAALAAFQAEMPTVSKTKRADVPMKSGGRFSYTYADLAGITEAVMPVLSSHGLSFSAKPRAAERGYELCGVLMHTSGEREEGALPINGNTPQEIGSSLTYMRRYLFGCLTGIVTEDDDDASAASKKRQPKEPAPAAPAQPATQRMSRAPQESATGEMTPRTRGQLFALFAQKGVAEGDQLSGANKTLGTSYTSRSQFTEADARTLIAALQQRPDAEPQS